MIKIISSLVAMGLLPLVAHAQDVEDVLTVINDIITLLIPLIIGLAILLFIWGLIKYITSAGDASAQGEARSIMIWGVIIIFVMISIWGLVNVLSETFGLDTGGVASDLPESPF